MLESFLDPVILFFILGVTAGIVRAELRLPDVVYEMLSIYLLLAIGLKGGVQLASTLGASLISPVLGTLGLGVTIPVIAYAVLRKLGRFNRADSAAIAAHYGSVSAVTFAVVLAFLDRQGVAYEGFMTVLLVVMEIPAIAVGILIARLRASKPAAGYGTLVREVFLNKSVYLLVGGLLVGWAAGPQRMGPMGKVFFDPFKGMLALFLLEMGIVAAHRLSDLKRAGPFLAAFGVLMPLVSGVLGVLIGTWAGLSLGGTVVLATLAASASYIAAPAAMRLAVPEANPTLYLTASLGITFPFNVTLGIPIYYAMAQVGQALTGG